jgi:hypothetical protein
LKGKLLFSFLWKLTVPCQRPHCTCRLLCSCSMYGRRRGRDDRAFRTAPFWAFQGQGAAVEASAPPSAAGNVPGPTSSIARSAQPPAPPPLSMSQGKKTLTLWCCIVPRLQTKDFKGQGAATSSWISGNRNSSRFVPTINVTQSQVAVCELKHG